MDLDLPCGICPVGQAVRSTNRLTKEMVLLRYKVTFVMDEYAHRLGIRPPEHSQPSFAYSLDKIEIENIHSAEFPPDGTRPQHSSLTPKQPLAEI